MFVIIPRTKQRIYADEFRIRFVQAGNIVATNIYRDDDKPLCKPPLEVI